MHVQKLVIEKFYLNFLCICECTDQTLSSWVKIMSENLFLDPRTSDSPSFQKALCESMFPLYFRTKETKFFRICKCAWITYKHMKLTQGKAYLTSTPTKERKIRIWTYLYVIKRKSK